MNFFVFIDINLQVLLVDIKKWNHILIHQIIFGSIKSRHEALSYNCYKVKETELCRTRTLLCESVSI